MKNVIITGTSRGIGLNSHSYLQTTTVKYWHFLEMPNLRSINHPNITTLAVDITKER